MNVTLKSGTNALKGQGYYYVRDEKLSATDFFVNKSRRREAGARATTASAGSVGGPVRLPRYNGRDRTFFFGAVEWLYDEFPEPGRRRCRREAMRNGDFSALLAQGITIYDPRPRGSRTAS